jgi:hypothetical protein
MSDPLSEARIRTQRYWFRDGMEEITLGMLFLLMGAWNLARARASWFMPATLIYILLCTAFAIVVPRIKTAMRERVTYRRSGYADAGGGWRRRLVFVLLGLVAGGAFCYAGRAGFLDPAIQWMPALAGIVMGATWAYVYVRQGLGRFLLVGVLALILGVAASIEFPPSEYRPSLAFGIYVVGVGCMCLCSGGAALWNYVRTPPASAEQA